MIKADVYSYVHSILSTSRSLAIEVRPRPRLCHRMGALQPRYLHITGVRRAGNRPSKYRSPLFLPLSLSLPSSLSLSFSALYATVTCSGFLSSSKREKRVRRILSHKNFNTVHPKSRVVRYSTSRRPV